jgi:hypothetical protein
MDDTIKGLYNKYTVDRVDGSSRKGCKHYGCNYFVLDMVHDPYARDAVAAYAEACKEKYPSLSKDLKILTETK